MEDKTFTYTARSTKDPQKVATFTLQDDTVSVQLGNALVEQLENARIARETDDEVNVSELAKPLATGVMQSLMRPIPVADFAASLEDNRLHTTAWLRPGGLRLAPVRISWDEIDNPEAARSFVTEVKRRRSAVESTSGIASVFDYWASWAAAGISFVVFVAFTVRLLKRYLRDDDGNPQVDA